MKLILASNKLRSKQREDELSSQLQRCSKALEDQLFSLEVDRPGLRQQIVLQKLQERFANLRTVTLRGIEFVLDPIWIRKVVEKASLQQKDRKKLLGKTTKIHDMSIGEIKDLLLDFHQLGLDLSKTIGCRIQSDSLVFHFIREPVLFQHALGLADAVHMSLFNLGLTVRFPAKKRVKEKSFFGYRWYFKGWSSRASRVVNVYSTSDRKFRLLLHYLRVFPKHLKEKEYVKMIKFSMNDLFSAQMNQERPDPYKYQIPIFPRETQRRLDRNLGTNPKLRCRLYFNILQSKSLCAPVGVDMIEEQYEKHRESLCRPQEECLIVPQDFLRKLYLYGKKVGEEISDRGLYDPKKTVFPNTRATVELPRHRGGAEKQLRPQRQYFKGSAMETLISDLRGKKLNSDPHSFHLNPQNQMGATRLEPLVVGLFGPPASGKTTLVQVLTRRLWKLYFSEMEFNDVVYSRSCATSHWDGYNNQPIVVLDDFGQNHEDRSDLSEFEQLVSSNRYVLPMASLEDKGRLFTSPIIIATSNMAYGSNFNNLGNGLTVEEPEAVWRRFKIPILLLKDGTPDQPKTKMYLQRVETRLEDDDHWLKKHQVLAPSQEYVHPVTQNVQCWGSPSSRKLGPSKEPFFQGTRLMGTEALVSKIKEQLELHISYHDEFLEGFWDQKIVSARIKAEIDQDSQGVCARIDAKEVELPHLPTDHQVVQRFPALPPYHPPVVDAIALSEPLKVRMITKAEAETKVLKPLQMALFQYLGQQPQFALTSGCTKSTLLDSFEESALAWIDRIEQQIQSIESRSEEGDLWLSGDYTAATDNFPMSVTNALLEGILSEIDHEPTRMWARWECSPHIIRYPIGLDDGVQTSGQLMGSLLSFPLLCFLNDFIVSESGFEKGKYLINGDDVVAKGPMSTITQWRNIAPQVGLSLSLGKNFISEDFCTVNSQLFYNAECQHTGKVSCQTRTGLSLGFCFQESQFYFGCHDEMYQEFIRRNILELRKTPRSLFVSTDLGGLGLVTDLPRVDRKLAHQVYLRDFLKPFLSSPNVPGFPDYQVLMIPEFQNDWTRGCLKDLDESEKTLNILRQVFAEEPVLECFSSDLTHCEFKKDLKQIGDQLDPVLLDQFHKTKLTDLPILSSRRINVLFVKSGNVRWIRKRILDHVVQCLIHVANNPQFEDFGDELRSLTLEELKDFDLLSSCRSLFEPDFEHVQQKFIPFEGFEDLLDSDFKERTQPPKLFPHDQIEEFRRFDLPGETVGIDHPKDLPR